MGGDTEQQVRGRDAPSDADSAATSGLGRRVLATGLLIVVVVIAALAGVWLLLRQPNAQSPPNLPGDNLPAYRFYWLADAPGSLTAEQAYADEGRAGSA